MQTLADLIAQLPPDMRREVQDFVEFLLEKQAARPKGQPHLAWAGALRDLRGRCTAVELQHLLAEWRSSETAP